jgi:hypothetical protein
MINPKDIENNIQMKVINKPDNIQRVSIAHFVKLEFFTSCPQEHVTESCIDSTNMINLKVIPDDIKIEINELNKSGDVQQVSS